MNLNRFVFLLVLFFSILGTAQGNTNSTQLKKFDDLIDKAQDDSLSDSERLLSVKSAIDLARQMQNDSILLKAYKTINLLYLADNDFKAYISANHNILKISRSFRDSLSVGRTYSRLGYAFAQTEVSDSAYFYYSKSAQLFDAINNKEELSFSLGSLCYIQIKGKDYFGAEENAVRALKAIENSEETNEILDQKWILNNHIANIATSLRNYNKAIEYHTRALEVARKMTNDFNNSIYSLNNIAVAKREQGAYTESKEILEELITTENLFNEEPDFYALVLENLAYSSYLSGNYNSNRITELFKSSYAISDSIQDDFAKTGTLINWARFNKGLGDFEGANSRANEAYTISKSIQNTEYLLESLLLLSSLNEGERGKQYLNEHIKLTDSLLQVERNVRNKFARIELETDRLEAENEQISKENLYLGILSIGLLLTAILTYVVISQRAKNRKLKLIQVQQKANEDIYNLMLQQQDKVEEARTVEKKRISEELHDGVLGRLFGTRLSLDSINFKDGKEAMMTRSNYIGQLKTIEEDIRKISHELNTDFVSGSGFMDIVTELIETQTQAYGLESQFNYTDDINWDAVSNKTKINIYRIVQESMQNIYKHAAATALEISISLENDVICLDITDNGQGFDTGRSKKGIGLKNMTSRVADIKGEISFNSQPGNGTTVNVKIPYIHQST